MIPYRITGLEPEPFVSLFGLSDEELAARGVLRYVADKHPGFPDRIEMRDLEIGERALLLNYTHHDVATPYRSSHAIFVREGATTRYDRAGEIPASLRIRQLSVRGFDRAGMMIEADVLEGTALEGWIAAAFANPDVAYLHAHNAKRGCYAARIGRA